MWVNISIDKKKLVLSELFSLPLVLGGIALLVSIILVLTAISYIFAMQRFKTPLITIRDGAKQLGIKSNPRPLPLYGPRLAKEALAAINNMQTRIQQLVVERLATVAGLSHDVKTPLTRIKLMVELLKEQSPKEALFAEIDQIEYLTNQAMRYARSDYHAEGKVKLDLVSLVEMVTNELQSMTQQVSSHIEVDKHIILGQAVNLRRAFTNIINNAIQYGDHALVTIKKIDQKLVISIADHGPGIPIEEYNKVFAPFYRLNHPHSDNSKGTGLGLCIAKAAITTNNGVIELSQNKPSGLIVTVIFG